MTEHKAKVVDWCYGMTGGIKIRCSCGDYWVISQGANVSDSITQHQKEKNESQRVARRSS